MIVLQSVKSPEELLKDTYTKEEKQDSTLFEKAARTHPYYQRAEYMNFPKNNIFTCVEKNRHFLCSLQVSLCKKFFLLEKIPHHVLQMDAWFRIKDMLCTVPSRS